MAHGPWRPVTKTLQTLEMGHRDRDAEVLGGGWSWWATLGIGGHSNQVT